MWETIIIMYDCIIIKIQISQLWYWLYHDLMKMSYLLKHFGGSDHSPFLHVIFLLPCILWNNLHWYSTDDNGGYSGKVKEVMSPLSIDGGGPHFAFEPKNTIFECLRDQAKVQAQIELMKGQIKHNIKVLAVCGCINYCLKKV